MNLPANLLYAIESWSKEDVRKWLEYCIEEYSLGDINLNDFEMNGKALLLLNENGFKQRSVRSGDILYKALQQHHSLIKSFTCQTFSYPLWNSFPLSSPSFMRHYNFPFSSEYLHPVFDYKLTNASIPTRQMSTSIAPPLEMPDQLMKQEQQTMRADANETSRQIRYYSDRIDFHGEIIMKPSGAKNCRILWEFLYILLEDSQYTSIIHWENREKMIFRIVQADKLAALWGLQKNRLSMTYEKLSRGMRYYYSNNIITKEQSKRLLYRFMRSPEEIRKNIKRSINIKPSNSYLPLFSATNLSRHHHPICKSDRSSSSSPDSSADSDKQYYHSSSKFKQTIPLSLTNRLLDQPMNLVVPKEGENFRKLSNSDLFTSIM